MRRNWTGQISRRKSNPLAMNSASRSRRSLSKRLLKAEAWPSCRDMETWRADSMRFRGDAAFRFVPSMRQRIGVDRIYQRALRAVPRAVDGQAAPPPAPVCPFTLDWLLSEEQ